MAANDSAVQNGTEKISTNALATVNGVDVTVDAIEVQRFKVGFGSDGAFRDVDAANGLPVVGSFFQATQPVSAASLPLPAGAATETTVAGIRTDLGTDGATPPAVLGLGTGVRGWLRSIYEKLTGTLAVTGTFWQATQPVSGTFFQAAQPVTDNAGSLTVDAPVGTPAFVRLSDGAAAITTLPVSLAVLPTLAAGVNNIGTVQPPAITKGTQGTIGFTTQQLHDAGRNARHFLLDAFTAAPVAEAVQSVVQWYGNVAVAGTTQPALVPAGKTLRLISWNISTKSLATVGSAVVRVRVNTAGLGVLASPLTFSFEAGSRAGATTVAMTGGLDTQTGTFPEGFEIPAGSGLAFSMAGYGPAGALTLQGVTRFAVYGYEY